MFQMASEKGQPYRGWVVLQQIQGPWSFLDWVFYLIPILPPFHPARPPIPRILLLNLDSKPDHWMLELLSRTL